MPASGEVSLVTAIGVEAGFLDGVLDEGLVGQGLERGAGLGDQNEDGLGDVDLGEDGGGVIRVDVGDELRVHLEAAVDLRPVFKGDVDGAGTEVGAADADLAGRRELLTGFVDDLAGMDFLDEFGDARLLFCVEVSLVDTVGDDVVAELAAAQLMEDETVLAGIDDRAVVEFFVLVGKLRLVGEGLQCFQDFVVDRTGGIVEGEPFGDGHIVLGNALRSALPCHDVLDADFVPELEELVIRFKGI